MLDEAELAELRAEGVPIAPDEPVLSTETKEAAGHLLEQILSAWVSGIWPGRTVQRVKPKARRGAPRKLDDGQDAVLLEEFIELLAKLNEQAAGCFSSRPLPLA